MNLTTQHIAAKKILDWYMEKLEDDDSMEAKDALQYLHLQLLKYKANTTLNTLYSYPITVDVPENR